MHAHVACMRMRQGTLEQKHWTRQCTAGRLQAKVHSHVSEIPELETARFGLDFAVNSNSQCCCYITSLRTKLTWSYVYIYL